MCLYCAKSPKYFGLSDEIIVFDDIKSYNQIPQKHITTPI